MSLFSRLDRVRTREREREQEESLFSVPDLGQSAPARAPRPVADSDARATLNDAAPGDDAPSMFAAEETIASSVEAPAPGVEALAPGVEAPAPGVEGVGVPVVAMPAPDEVVTEPEVETPAEVEAHEPAAVEVAVVEPAAPQADAAPDEAPRAVTPEVEVPHVTMPEAGAPLEVAPVAATSQEPDASAGSVFAPVAPEVTVVETIEDAPVAPSANRPRRALSPLERLQRRVSGSPAPDDSDAPAARPSMFASGESTPLPPSDPAPRRAPEMGSKFSSSVSLPPREVTAAPEPPSEPIEAPVATEIAADSQANIEMPPTVALTASAPAIETNTEFSAPEPQPEPDAPTLDASTLETARVEAPTPAAPVVESSSATPIGEAAPTAPSRSPFDRLMAERAAVSNAAPSAAPVPSVAAPAPMSLTERLAARAAAEASAPAEPPAPTEEPSTPISRRFSAAARDAKREAVPPSAAPVEPAPQPTSHLRESLLAAKTEAPVAPPVVAEPAKSAAPVPASAAPVPASESRAPVAPPDATPSAPASRAFSDRFAAREILDRDLQVPATPAPNREMAATGGDLARVEEDPLESERDAKTRLLFRHKHLVFDSVLGSLDPRILQSATREGLRPAIEKSVDGALREFNLALESAERNWMIEEFWRETTDLGPLVTLLDDPGVNKIIVSGASDVAIEKLGRIEHTAISFRDDDHLLSLIRRVAEMTGGRVDAKVPLLDRPLPDGARIRAKVPPLAPQPTLTIEKSTGNPFVALKRQQAERSRGEALPYNQLRERIQQRLLREFEGQTAATTGNPDKLRAQVEEMIGAVIVEERVAVTRAERAALVMDLLNEIVGLGPIEPLLNDPEVDEVMVNGPFQIYVEKKGKLELSTQRFRDNAHVMQVIDRIVAPLGRRVDEKSPMVDGRLRDGSRFNAVIPPLALSGPTMTIRKFARDPFTMTDLINFGSLTRESAQFLQAAVEGRLNIIVSGGTGSGKTTTLNVLSSFIPSTERIVTIEDAAELQMRQEHVIRLETRPPNIEGIGEVGIRDLVRNALRMRPDRIVVGECRGGEALDMLQAMNTGHDGSLTTAHSNGPRDTLKRLEIMVMMAGFDLPIKAIREQCAMAVQLIVHQERMRDGKRRVTAITELVGMEGDVVTMQDIFRFEQERIDDDGRIIGSLAPTGLRPKNFETITDNGVELSMDLFHPRAMEGGSRGRLGGR